MLSRDLRLPLVWMFCVACGSPQPIEPSPEAPAVRVPVVAATVEPTVLTAAQRERDAASAPLARTIAEAYANRIGWYSPMIAHWSPDGRELLYGSLRDGSPQIYAGDPSRPADPPRAISSGPQRATWASHTPDGKHILFMRDRGDEKHHIWRVPVDGGEPVDLTPTDGEYRQAPRMARDRPDMFVFSELSSAANETRVHVQSVAGGPPRLAHTSVGLGTHGEVTADGTRCLLGIDAGKGMVVSEVDLASGVARRIYPPAGQSLELTHAAYSADFDRVYVGVDEAEASTLRAIDVRTGEELARYSQPSRLAALVSPAGDHVIAYIDAGNHGELRVLDAGTLALVRPIDVPLGDIKIGAFRPDGREFSIAMSVPDRPPDIYAVDPARGTIRPLREDPRGGIDALTRMTATIAEVTAHDGLTIPINVYLPQDPPGEPVARRPTIVSFHGGPASSHAVRWDPYVRFFVSLGYAVIEPNVRGSSGFGLAYELADNREKRADWLRDLATVNAWTRAQPWCDADRIAVWGESYGGYTTLMALTRQPKLWRAGVDLYGIADLTTLGRAIPPAFRGGFTAEFGDLDADAALLDEFSPMRGVAEIVAPLFVYAGQNDPRVPRSESDRIVQALRARAQPVEYMVAMDEGHGVERRDNQIELLTRTARFLADAMAAR